MDPQLLLETASESPKGQNDPENSTIDGVSYDAEELQRIKAPIFPQRLTILTQLSYIYLITITFINHGFDRLQV